MGDFGEGFADAVGLVVGEFLVDGDAEYCRSEFLADWERACVFRDVCESGLLGQRFWVVDRGWDAFFVEGGAELVAGAGECIQIYSAGVEVPSGV